jgi:circadian clock protein KaiB
MSDYEPVNENEAFERALRDSKNDRFLLRLFIAGNTQKSAEAIESIRSICENHLKGRYSLEVVDISQQPEYARSQQVIAVPTLVKMLPLPLRRVIGDLSNSERVLVGLNIAPLDAGDGENPDPRG